MFLYTYKAENFYSVRIVQMVSDLDSETCKRTYLNSNYMIISVFLLNEGIPQRKHVETVIFEHEYE